MRETTYRPVDCGLHSTYENLAMRRQQVRACCDTESGQRLYSGKVVDVFTLKGAEYLRLQLTDGENLDIRLDHIREIST